MRITFVLSSLTLSGGVRVIIEYANRLVRRGHHICLVSPFDDFNDTDIRSEIDPRILVRQSRYPYKHNMNMNILHKIALVWLLAYMIPPSDIIISTHTPTTIVSLIAGWLLRRGRLVWLYQDYEEMFIGRRVESWLLRHALRWHKLTMVVSDYSKDELRKYYSAGRIVKIGEGLSHADLFVAMHSKFRKKSKKRSEKRILYVGDMRPRKGLFDFLQAVDVVYKTIPDIKLIIVSKESCKIETKVPFEYIYRPQREKLAELYATCDLFVSASWWESFGLPPLEALACGAPSVITDSRGVREFVVPNENCLLVPPRDVSLLASAMIRVLSDKNLSDKFRLNGPRVVNRFRWCDAVNRMEKALRDV